MSFPRPAHQRVVVVAALQHVAARTALEGVIVVAALQGVVADVAVQGVIAVVPADHVIAGEAVDHVRVILRQLLLGVPDGPSVVPVGQGGRRRLPADVFRLERPIDGDRNVPVLPLVGVAVAVLVLGVEDVPDVGGLERLGAERDPVPDLRVRVRLEVLDRVVAVTLHEHEGVRAVAARQGVVALVALDLVVAVAAVQLVVALAAAEHVIARAAHQLVVALVAEEPVGPRVARQHVVVH